MIVPDTARGKRIEAEAIVAHAMLLLQQAQTLLAMADEQEGREDR